MNKLKVFSIALFLLLSCGCAPKMSDLIVGKWETSSGNKIEAEFQADGTCSFILNDKGYDILDGPELQSETVLVDANGKKIKLKDLAGQIEIFGRWEIDNNSKITLTFNTPSNMPPATSTVSIKGGVMEMVDADNAKTTVYSRVQ